MLIILGLCFGVTLISCTKSDFAEYTHAISNPLASAVCGQLEAFQETQEIQPSLKTVPSDIPLLANDGKWSWKCSGRNCSEVHYVETPKMRILGGERAKHDEFPWDVSIRFIYDWGQFWPEPRKEEDVAKNDFKGLKESHRCTGTLYSPKFVLTSAWCAHRGREYMVTKNRFVIWISRGRFLDAKMIEALPGEKPKGKIHMYPDFDPDPDTPYTKDHDIALLEMPKPFKFSDDVYALQVAPAGMDFTGQEAVFTGWGTTVENLTGSLLGSMGKMKPAYSANLYKLTMTIVEHEGDCEDVIRQNLEVFDKYNSGEDLKPRYLCAKVDKVGAGACGGDVGGPLICEDPNDPNKRYLCGIRNAWALVTKCPSKNGLEVFVKPSHYLEWMQGIAGRQRNREMRPPRNRS